MTTALMPEGRQKFFDNNGRPLAGGKVYTYAAGTTTPKATYQDSAGTTPHANPIVLDSKGEATIFWDGAYKVDVQTAAGVSISGYPVDNYKTDPAGIWGIFAQLISSTGAALIGFIQSGVGAVFRTALSKLRERPTPEDYGAVGNLGVDDTAALQKLLDRHLIAYIDGTYLISDALTLRSGQSVHLTGRSIIKQVTAGKPAFKAVGADNTWIHCNGAQIIGPGVWSASWTGNQGHDERGIFLVGCTRSGVTLPTLKNWGNAGIAVVGGRGIKIAEPTIEGTHLYTTPLPAGANFQSGIYITDDATYGKADELTIVSPDISGTAQGILRENQGSASLADVALNIVGPNIHDIPGQHAFYIQGGLVSVSNPTLSNINLAGFKVQSADANQHISGFTCTGASAKSVKSNLFELATIGTGSLSNVRVSGIGDACGTGISINGKVSGVVGDLSLTNSDAYAAYIIGNGVKDVDLKLLSDVCGLDGVLITATNASGIKIRPTLRNCNNGNTSNECGIRVQSASAEVELFDPDVTDSNSRMLYGLFNAVSGSTVKVRGSARFTGAKDTAVRATGLITEWPTEATLSGINGEFTGIGQVRSSIQLITKIRTVSSSNTVLWYCSEIPDESAVLVSVDLVGKLATSNERRAVTFSSLFYRDGGGIATQQGASSVLSDIASAGFVGTYAIQGDGASGIVLLANSAGGGDCDWEARVIVTAIA